MDKNTLELLEFYQVLNLLGECCVSESGKKRAVNLRPYNELQKVERELKLLEEAREYRDEIVGLIEKFPPLEGLFAHIQEDKILDEDGLWGIRVFLDKSKKLKEFISSQIKTPLLAERFTPFPWPGKLWQALSRCMDDKGHIRDQASPALLSIRGEIRKIQRQCTKKIIEYMADDNISRMLQDEYLTISSDRYVLALKANFKGKIKGIVHDYSNTGETCYFEPLFLVELNNKLQELRKTERDEINKVLKYLTSIFTEEEEKVKWLYGLMVEMDLLRAKLLFAEKIHGEIITISNEKVYLKNVRHPLLFLKEGGNVSPVDIVFGEDKKGLILTGGNSGGKTVALKTLGVCALMAYTSLPLPCDKGSVLPFWEDIFVFLGDEQSLDENLSTFTAQIKKLRDIWPRITSSTLVLLDEFGTGTDPTQGSALAQAVLDSLLSRGAWIFCVTHFPALKVYGLSKENVRPATVLFDPRTKKPLYKIAYDQVGTSQALDVAKEFGMPEEILSRAREYLLIDGDINSSVIDKLNELAVKKERELVRLKQKEMELEREKKKLKEQYEKKLESLVKEIGDNVREIVSLYRKNKIQRKVALKKLKEAREKIKKQIVVNGPKSGLTLKEIREGMELFYIPWNKKGVVDRVDTKDLKIRLNLSGVNVWVKLEEVRLAGSNKTQENGGVHLKFRGEDIHPHVLDIRGKRVEEAESLLVQFLDRAVYMGSMEVEIIHGRGEGILRNCVHHILKSHPFVKTFSLAPENRGGDGVTIVQFKND